MRPFRFDGRLQTNSVLTFHAEHYSRLTLINRLLAVRLPLKSVQVLSHLARLQTTLLAASTLAAGVLRFRVQ